MDPRVASAIPLRTSGVKAEKGKVIAAEISKYGTAMSPPEGELLQVIGSPDDPEVQAQSVIFRYGLTTKFPEAVHREIAASSFAIGAEEVARRADLRDLPIVTIDGETARDFDDAVFARRQDDHYELFVSIADVAYYVRPDTALDQEAYAAAPAFIFRIGRSPCFPKRSPTASAA